MVDYKKLQIWERSHAIVLEIDELARFLVIAMGSAAEAEYQLLLAKDLGYMDDVIYKKLDDELNQIRKMLNAFIKKVNVRK